MIIKLLGVPVSTNVFYRRHGNIMYISKEGRAIKNSYILQARTQWKQPILIGDVKIAINLYFKDNRRRDIDNWHKATLDSMTGIVWNDDSQITEMTVRKFIDKTNPRIEVEILL